jgi:hypothetical protein
MKGATFEAAEKPWKTGESTDKHPAGAKSHSLLSASCGTMEVVPCYNTRLIPSFSAASLAVPHMPEESRALASDGRFSIVEKTSLGG